MPEPFLKAAECWVPRGAKLMLKGGIYGSSGALREAGAAVSFEPGEGLPGCVWSSDKPQIWSAAETHVAQLAPAERAGLEVGVAWPLASGGRAGSALVTLWCGSDDGHGGCAEQWDLDPGVDQFRHAGGYYGALEPFGALSRHLRFGTGNGLPGMTASRGLPTLIEDTRTSSAFMRAEIARECGLAFGLGIPIFREGRVAHVVVFLASEHGGLAKGVEVWVPSRSDSLALECAAYSHELEKFAADSRGASVHAGQDIVGKVYRSSLPAAWPVLEPPAFQRSEAAAQCGVTSAFAIPIIDGANVVAVLLLLD